MFKELVGLYQLIEQYRTVHFQIRLAESAVVSEGLGLADNDVRDKVISVLSVSDVRAICIPLSVSQSRILPSVEIVTTCHGMNFPLCCKAVFAACSSPPQQGTSMRTTVTLFISLLRMISVSFSE